MGKISKALEKAEKESLSRPAAKPTPEPVKPDADKANAPSVVSESDRTVDQRSAADRQPRKVVAVEHPRDTQPLHHSVPRTATAAEAPTVDTPPKAVQTNRLEKSPLDKAVSPDKERPNPPDESSGLRTESEPNHRADGVNIALVKPEVVEPPAAVREPVPKQEAYPGDQQATVAGRSSSGKKVRVNYSRTQVQINDPEVLRNNRIFSVFDDIETTDQIKILRTQILRKLKAIGGNSILVTSANPYEGKTFTSINLGVSIAKEFDRTVLIIDADIRKPTQKHTSFSTEFFSLKVEYGLTDYLEGDADISDILINPGIDKLTLIPGGVPVDNSPELLNSGRMEEMMREIKSRYPSDRVVIVDGPAILPFTDALILSRYVDGVVPVIESEKTSSEDLKKMMLRLKEVNVLGVVLNKNKG
jgi:protein-tyrosine kinase